MADNAQFEIREYANAVAEYVKEKFPTCYQAFEDYWLNSVTFSAQEMKLLNKSNMSEILMQKTTVMKGRELQEFKDKLKNK